MEHPIIEIKNISKKYNITHQRGGYVALRDILTNIMMSPFAFLKKKAKQVAGLETKEEFWALKDINFEVKKGEVIGIIGRNGAGKSTLLKILSQITPPTHGEIKLRGKVGSLLEVGTGFHPELSGRENIFLNGAILGMTRKEIAEKFDAIVEFAGIEKFLDTPVKYYSSGMYVRLAFSVAAHMEPDILIVDEVLAVGDAEFQKKCLGKMEEVTQNQGRTILFVSHDLEAIKKICNKTIMLDKGEIVTCDDTEKVINKYLGTRKELLKATILPASSNKILSFEKIEITNPDGAPTAELEYNKEINIKVIFRAQEDLEGVLLCIYIIKDGKHYAISTEVDQEKNPENVLRNYKKGSYESCIKLPAYSLPPGYYNLEISIAKPHIGFIEKFTDIAIRTTSTHEPPNKLWKKIPIQAPIIADYKTNKNN
jgi:lipopolysaccharide transport system ATP-binding protein